jgi:2-methylfumaryl-CoA hydratase
MVRKRDAAAPAPEPVIPELAPAVAAADLVIPEGLDFADYPFALAGERWRWGDYEIGEKIDHVDGATVQETEHMLATRLWQNTSKVHFNVREREDGRLLAYGGHVISSGPRALSFNGLANAQPIVAINAGSHANPCFAGDTVYAWSEVLDKAETAKPSVGALRLRLVAVKNLTGGGLPAEIRDREIRARGAARSRLLGAGSALSAPTGPAASPAAHPRGAGDGRATRPKA